MVLGVTIDSILEIKTIEKVDYRCSFETFKSNTCHHVKDMGDIDCVIGTLEKPYFPAGVVVAYAATGDESIKEKALAGRQYKNGLSDIVPIMNV